MWGWFSSIQFLQPWLLLGGLLTPLLIYAYLRKQPQRRKIVSSLLVLRSLSKRPAIKTKFQPPLRFYLELLALLLLVAAASMPSTVDEGRQAAIVLDTSLSMRSLSVKGGGVSTRLELAKASAIKWVDDQPGDTRFTLFLSAPKLARVGSEDLSRDSIRDVITELKASATTDTLEASLEELAAESSFDRIYVVSDKTIEYDENSSEKPLLQSSENGGIKSATKITGVSVGSRQANFALNRFAYLPSGIGGDKPKLIASLSFFGSAAEKANVSFSSVAARGLSRPLGNLVREISPERPEEVSIELQEEPSPGEVFQVAVKAAKADQDALNEDDTAWVSPSGGAGKRILLVSPAGALEKNGFESISAFEVEHVTPEQYASIESQALTTYSLILFHRCAPSRTPSQPSLLILPPSDNPLFPVQQEVGNPRITSWMEEHPITSYLKVPLLTPGRTELFDVPLWAQSVIRVEQGSFLVSGESHGIRFAASGVELLPFEGGRTPALSVLTLNLINWLSGGAELTGSLLSGSSMRLEPGKVWKINLPSGKTQSLGGKAETNPLLSLDEPGVYRLDDGSALEQKLIAVNAFFSEESSTFVSGSLRTLRQVEHEQINLQGARPWWPWLLAAALCFLVIELLLAFFQPKLLSRVEARR